MNSNTQQYFYSNPEQGTNKKKRKVPTNNNTNSQNQNPYHINPTTATQHKLTPTHPTINRTNLIHPPVIDHKNNNQAGYDHPDLPFQFHLLRPDTFPDSLIDPLALAKILSSHHVRMRMKPISSPRHYGRHLQKLTLSRTTNGKPNSEHSATPPPIQPPPTKAAKKKLTPSPQPKRISKRQVTSSFNSKNKSASALIKSKNNHQILKPPILPNLYDPSLKIDQIPTATTTASAAPFSPSTSSPSKRILHLATPGLPSTLDQFPEKKITFPEGYDGEFKFKLEMVEVSQRLAGLHLAISADKRNRLVQIQEAMKIAMEKVDRSSMGGHEGEPDPTALVQPSDHHSLMNREDDHFLELDSSTSNLRTASDHPGRNNHQGPALTSKVDASRSHILSSTANPDGGYSNDHGPSGPPPSEPPPPLPHQQPTKTNKTITSSGVQVASATDTDENNQNRLQPPKKNRQQKGKKKRSAHANANNIHHRDNYVPSRLPNRYQFNSLSGSSEAAKNPSSRNSNDWSALNFLAHDQFEDSSAGPNEFIFIDPNLSLSLGPLGTGPGNSSKTLKKLPKSEPGGSVNNKQPPAGQHYQLGRSPISRFFVEPDEWICSFCEYQLWFGDEISLIKVIKNRKEVLRRRRRAKERAANGVNMKNVTINNTTSNATTTINHKNSSNNLKSSTRESIVDEDTDQKNKKKKKKKIGVTQGSSKNQSSLDSTLQEGFSNDAPPSDLQFVDHTRRSRPLKDPDLPAPISSPPDLSFSNLPLVVGPENSHKI